MARDASTSCVAIGSSAVAACAPTGAAEGARPRRVLILGGWSPGPLDLLKLRLNSVEFREPSIPMPPAGFRWCANPCWGLLLAYPVFALAVLPGLLPEEAAERFGVPAWVAPVLAVLVSLVVARCLIAGVVWFAVKDSCRIASREIASFEPHALLCFSWGGAVACWLLARAPAAGWRGPSLLLAPTVRAVVRVGWPLMSFPRFSSSGGTHVFHADDDGFCPASQIDDFRNRGCEVHVCNDDHILSNRRSVEAIAGCLQQMLTTVGNP